MRGGGLPQRLPFHGWLGLLLVATFWALNWSLSGLRSHLCFFPLWLGFCLTVDGLSIGRTGTSLLRRSRAGYVALFLISIPIWWLFEAINLRTQNWRYLGAEQFDDLTYAVLASLSFSTVVPAVLGSAELVLSFGFVRRFRRGPVIRPGRKSAGIFVLIGLSTLGLTLLWPLYGFPFVWVSLYFLFESVNLAAGNRTLLDRTASGDWSQVAALWIGVLVCGFFWEMWNVFSYPKWVYSVPWVGFWHVFEMPILGYFGYLPFSLELFAAVHLVFGLAGRGRSDFVSGGPFRS